MAARRLVHANFSFASASGFRDDFSTPGTPDTFMDLNLFFALLGGLLVLAFVANRLVRFTGVPDVIILMATGVLIGPVLHWVNPDLFRGATHGFGSLALILILFEGGLELKFREILSHFAGGFFLLFSITCSARLVSRLFLGTLCTSLGLRRSLSAPLLAASAARSFFPFCSK